MFFTSIFLLLIFKILENFHDVGGGVGNVSAGLSKHLFLVLSAARAVGTYDGAGMAMLLPLGAFLPAMQQRRVL